MPAIERQYFMTIGEFENAVASQITDNTTDYNTLVAALQSASNAVLANYPGAALHYSYWAYQNVSGQWIGQLDIYRGESNTLNHWDVALMVNMSDVEGSYTADMSTLQTINYAQSGSAIGTFTPPVQGGT
jgi:hypothetical protein